MQQKRGADWSCLYVCMEWSDWESQKTTWLSTEKSLEFAKTEDSKVDWNVEWEMFHRDAFTFVTVPETVVITRPQSCWFSCEKCSQKTIIHCICSIKIDNHDAFKTYLGLELNFHTDVKYITQKFACWTLGYITNFAYKNQFMLDK